MARPMPRLDPVMSATFPFQVTVRSSSLFLETRWIVPGVRPSGGGRSAKPGAAEHDIPDPIRRQEVVRKAEVDPAGGVPLLDLLGGQRERQAAEVVLELRELPGPNDGDDLSLPQPVPGDLRGGLAEGPGHVVHRTSHGQVPLGSLHELSLVQPLLLAGGRRLAVLARQEAAGERRPGRLSGVQGDALPVPAVLLALLPAGGLHPDTPHGLGRGSEEPGGTPPLGGFPAQALNNPGEKTALALWQRGPLAVSVLAGQYTSVAGLADDFPHPTGLARGGLRADRGPGHLRGGRRLAAPGDFIPSVRDLANELVINPNTVARAFVELEKRGVVEARRGRGTAIAAEALDLCRRLRLRIVRERIRDGLREAVFSGLPVEEIKQVVEEELALARGGQFREKR